MYPVKERLVEDMRADGDASAFVDIGGGNGQTLTDFPSNVPEYTGRLVLQDIPDIIATARAKGVENNIIELQGHNFFKPQPVKGARAYVMRSVLHD